MKSHSGIRPWLTLAALCGLAIATVAFRARADQWDKRTVLTVDQPMQVMNTVLQPGKYVFKLADSNSDRHIVQIFNGDQTHIIDTILAIPNYRLQPTGDSRFMYWETPPGNVRALRAWFYPGDNFGQEFRYPKHLEQLALARVSEVAVAQSPVPEPEVITIPELETPAPAAPEVREAPPPEKQPAVIAQNNPPPSPSEAEPAPKEEPAPQQLPKTASPYPLIGLGGLLSLGAYGLLWLKRVA